MVESQPSKLLVAGSIPVSRSSLRQALAVRSVGRAVVIVAPGVSGQGVRFEAEVGRPWAGHAEGRGVEGGPM